MSEKRENLGEKANLREKVSPKKVDEKYENRVDTLKMIRVMAIVLWNVICGC